MTVVVGVLALAATMMVILGIMKLFGFWQVT
jgi:hypothetical protein